MACACAPCAQAIAATPARSEAIRGLRKDRSTVMGFGLSGRNDGGTRITSNGSVRDWFERARLGAPPPKLEVPHERDHERSHLRVFRHDLDPHSVRAHDGLAGGPDGGHHDALVERPHELAREAERFGDLEQMAELDLASDGQRVDLAAHDARDE